MRYGDRTGQLNKRFVPSQESQDDYLLEKSLRIKRTIQRVKYQTNPERREFTHRRTCQPRLDHLGNRIKNRSDNIFEIASSLEIRTKGSVRYRH